MFSWISANIATIIGVTIIAAIFIFIVASEVKKRKAGKSGCGCGCDHCANSEFCHPQIKIKKYPDERSTEKISR